MRTFYRLFATLAVLIWAVGPAFAAPLPAPTARAITAPRGPAPHAPALEDLLYLAPVAFGITIRKSAADIAGKFVNRAQGATKDYADGVKGAGPEWEARTKEADDAWKQGTQEAINEGRFVKGVAEAGASKYQANAEKLGSERYGPGVRNSQDAYSKGVSPYLEVLRGLTLPPKGPRRSPQNRERSAAVMIALGNKRVSR